MIGAAVTVLVDRPLGSAHPDWPELIYPVNYGFIPGIMAPDGEDQDAYILGVDRPVKRFSGRVVAVIRREDDVEDKWVVAPEDRHFTREEIAEAVRFQERFFISRIEMDEPGSKDRTKAQESSAPEKPAPPAGFRGGASE